MTIDDLVLLTNGLSLTTGGQTLVCDRARIAAVRTDAIDMAFWIAGTDFVPRLRLTRERISRETPEAVACIVRRVARGAIGGDSER